MGKKDPFEQFECNDVVSALEMEIQRQMDELEKAYSRLGRRFQSMAEKETVGINELADRVVELKQKLRKLKEMNSQGVK